MSRRRSRLRVPSLPPFLIGRSRNIRTTGREQLKRLVSAVQLRPWTPTHLKLIAYFSSLIHHICSKSHESIIFDVRNLLRSLDFKDW